jgi:hypothetical protein
MFKSGTGSGKNQGLISALSHAESRFIALVPVRIRSEFRDGGETQRKARMNEAPKP